MHPLNFVRDDFITIETATGAKRVSRRRYRVSNKYVGTLTKYVGQIVRLVNLDNHREIGEHIDDILAVTLDDEINLRGGTSYTCAVGVPMKYLNPVAR